MAMLVRTGLIMLALAAADVSAARAPSPAPAPTAAPAPAAAPASQALGLAALKLLEPGLWELDAQGHPPKQSCIVDMASLIQIEHDQPNCSRFVIDNQPKSATVHYSCQRAGWGRTTVRVESETGAAIHTQGIARNQPFDYDVDAKRIGACGTPTAAKQR